MEEAGYDIPSELKTALQDVLAWEKRFNQLQEMVNKREQQLICNYSRLQQENKELQERVEFVRKEYEKISADLDNSIDEFAKITWEAKSRRDEAFRLTESLEQQKADSEKTEKGLVEEIHRLKDELNQARLELNHLKCSYTEKRKFEDHLGILGAQIRVLEEERDKAKFVARAMWDFIQEGCFLDDLEMGDVNTPEWELWVKGHVARDLSYHNPWVKEQV